MKILKWLTRKIYHDELKEIKELLDLKQARIENLKEQIRYLRNENIFTNERKIQ